MMVSRLVVHGQFEEACRFDEELSPDVIPIRRPTERNLAL